MIYTYMGVWMNDYGGYIYIYIYILSKEDTYIHVYIFTYTWNSNPWPSHAEGQEAESKKTLLTVDQQHIYISLSLYTICVYLSIYI